MTALYSKQIFNGIKLAILLTNEMNMVSARSAWKSRNLVAISCEIMAVILFFVPQNGTA